jgi:hypothetical protein
VWLLCGQYVYSSYGLVFLYHLAADLFKEGAVFIAAPLSRMTSSFLNARRLLAYVGFSGASILLVVSTRSTIRCRP